MLVAKSSEADQRERVLCLRVQRMLWNVWNVTLTVCGRAGRLPRKTCTAQDSIAL